MTARPLRRQRRPIARAPAAPGEMRRRRLESVPTGENSFNWRAGELVLGPSPKRGSALDDILARCWPEGKR
jgi:hypothetical protein